MSKKRIFKQVDIPESKPDEWASCNTDFFKSSVVEDTMPQNELIIQKNSKFTSDDKKKDTKSVLDMYSKPSSKTKARNLAPLQIPDLGAKIMSHIEKSQDFEKGIYFELGLLICMHVNDHFSACFRKAMPLTRG